MRFTGWFCLVVVCSTPLNHAYAVNDGTQKLLKIRTGTANLSERERMQAVILQIHGLAANNEEQGKPSQLERKRAASLLARVQTAIEILNKLDGADSFWASMIPPGILLFADITESDSYLAQSQTFLKMAFLIRDMYEDTDFNRDIIFTLDAEQRMSDVERHELVAKCLSFAILALSNLETHAADLDFYFSRAQLRFWHARSLMETGLEEFERLAYEEMTLIMQDIENAILSVDRNPGHLLHNAMQDFHEGMTQEQIISQMTEQQKLFAYNTAQNLPYENREEYRRKEIEKRLVAEKLAILNRNLDLKTTERLISEAEARIASEVSDEDVQLEIEEDAIRIAYSLGSFVPRWRETTLHILSQFKMKVWATFVSPQVLAQMLVLALSSQSVVKTKML